MRGRTIASSLWGGGSFSGGVAHAPAPPPKVQANQHWTLGGGQRSPAPAGTRLASASLEFYHQPIQAILPATNIPNNISSTTTLAIRHCRSGQSTTRFSYICCSILQSPAPHPSLLIQIASKMAGGKGKSSGGKSSGGKTSAADGQKKQQSHSARAGLQVSIICK